MDRAREKVEEEILELGEEWTGSRDRHEASLQGLVARLLLKPLTSVSGRAVGIRKGMCHS